MKYGYCLVVLCLLPGFLSAQSAIRGLGQFTIGITTADSLKNTTFREEAQSLVKGTIALTCPHIRTFKASGLLVSGLPITDVYLFFYDNTLFKLSCQYTPELEKAFAEKHGQGRLKPQSRLSLCRTSSDKPMIVRTEAWQNGDIWALAVQAKGHSATCEPAEEARLTLVSQRFSALSSDCELRNTYQFIDDSATIQP